MVDKKCTVIVSAKSSEVDPLHILEATGVAEQDEPRGAEMGKPVEAQAELPANCVDGNGFLKKNRTNLQRLQSPNISHNAIRPFCEKGIYDQCLIF